MRKIKIVTDSCSDLKKSIREKYDIDYLQMFTVRDAKETPASLEICTILSATATALPQLRFLQLTSRTASRSSSTRASTSFTSPAPQSSRAPSTQAER